MSRTNVAYALLLAALVGCSSSSDDMPGDDSGGGGGDGGGDRPGFTDGVSTLAGFSNPGYQDGDREVNLFNNPVNVALGPDNTLYVADFDNGKLRAVDMEGNATTVIAQSGFSRPFGLTFAGNTLYVSTDRDPAGEGGAMDLMSGTIWKVDTRARTATPVAPRIGRPRGLAALSDGRIAIADYRHQVIEIFDPRTGLVTPLAGMWDTSGYADGVGSAARFSTPYALVQRNDGRLVVTDFDNNRIRLVGLDGTVSTIAGGTAGYSDGGVGSALFNHPQGIARASNGDIYVTDIDNFRVRRIDANLSRVSTLAGDGTPGYKDDDNLTHAQFYGLEGIAVKPDGSRVFVADGTRGEDVPYNRIRVIKN